MLDLQVFGQSVQVYNIFKSNISQLQELIYFNKLETRNQNFNLIPWNVLDFHVSSGPEGVSLPGSLRKAGQKSHRWNYCRLSEHWRLLGIEFVVSHPDPRPYLPLRCVERIPQQNSSVRRTE